jgi:hypothetical protein
MSRASRRLAGVLLIILPAVMIGGVRILTFLICDPAYMKNPLRQDLWRAGHAHARVLVILTLLALRYVDEATLSYSMKWFVRLSLPSAATFLPVAFFFSVLTPDATALNGFIYLAYIRVNLDLWYSGPPTKGGHRDGSFTLRRSTDAPGRGA